jgi:hypothetical protein
MYVHTRLLHLHLYEYVFLKADWHIQSAGRGACPRDRERKSGCSSICRSCSKAAPMSLESVFIAGHRAMHRFWIGRDEIDGSQDGGLCPPLNSRRRLGRWLLAQ